MLYSNAAMAGDVFEIVSAKFNDDISLPEQKAEMAKLNEVVSQFEGFRSRDYFYSHENGRWIDFVVWSDLELAKKASERAMGDPVATSVFVKMDDSTMIFSYYERTGGVKK